MGRFLRWADAQDLDLAMGWRLLAATGMRRGEALALRWWDVDLDAGRLAVRRSVGVVKAKGAGERLVEGPTKTGRSRVVDLDAGTVAALRAYRAGRGRLALDLVRDSALGLSNLDGTHVYPERFSRRFSGQVAQARKALGEERLPVIRLHDLRHTRAILLRADGVPVEVVPERRGRASTTVTPTDRGTSPDRQSPLTVHPCRDGPHRLDAARTAPGRSVSPRRRSVRLRRERS
jgi:integrase